jgi:hypothetical protein
VAAVCSWAAAPLFMAVALGIRGGAGGGAQGEGRGAGGKGAAVGQGHEGRRRSWWRTDSSWQQ